MALTMDRKLYLATWASCHKIVKVSRASSTKCIILLVAARIPSGVREEVFELCNPSTNYSVRILQDRSDIV